MTTVLLPYDGSDSAVRALRYLLRLPATQRPGQIHVLNVQESPMFHGEIVSNQDVRSLHEAQLARGREILRPAEEELLTAGANFRTHVVLGEAEHAIVDVGSQLQCDQIVMGTRGLGRIRSLALGSVAWKTVHLAKVPVTLVK